MKSDTVHSFYKKGRNFNKKHATIKPTRTHHPTTRSHRRPKQEPNMPDPPTLAPYDRGAGKQYIFYKQLACPSNKVKSKV